ncbi:MAG: hypothetical protein ACOH2I_04885 [Pseudomonas sp.]
MSASLIWGALTVIFPWLLDKIYDRSAEESSFEQMVQINLFAKFFYERGKAD